MPPSKVYYSYKLASKMVPKQVRWSIIVMSILSKLQLRMPG